MINRIQRNTIFDFRSELRKLNDLRENMNNEQKYKLKLLNNYLYGKFVECLRPNNKYNCQIWYTDSKDYYKNKGISLFYSYTNFDEIHIALNCDGTIEIYQTNDDRIYRETTFNSFIKIHGTNLLF